MTRTARAQFPWYEERACRSDRAEKTRTALLETHTVPPETRTALLEMRTALLEMCTALLKHVMPY